MKHKRKSVSWFYPLFVGVVTFNILRVITDLTKDDKFWQGDKQAHVLELLFSMLFCYLMDFIWRYRLNKSNKHRSVAKEYMLAFLELLVVSFISTSLGEIIRVIDAGDLLNRFLIFISYVPVLMLYYTLIRNDVTNEKYMEKILQLERIKADQSETELKFLKSQYHPHFLFNALNTIYFRIDEGNKEARQSVEQLSDLLRYQLYNIDKKVRMEQEINYLKSYIAFQQLRMSERLVLDVYFDPELKDQEIHSLLFQPLIENAFKYVRGDYKIRLELKSNGSTILFTIENTVTTNIDKTKEGGIGIENLKRRLDLLYPDKYSLEIGYRENWFVAKLIIKTD